MRRFSGSSIALLILVSILFPLASSPVTASTENDVTLSSQHEYLVPGTASNVSGTVLNDNQMRTRSFDLTINSMNLPSNRNITIIDTSLGPVYPAQSATTT